MQLNIKFSKQFTTHIFFTTLYILLCYYWKKKGNYLNYFAITNFLFVFNLKHLYFEFGLYVTDNLLIWIHDLVIAVRLY